MNYKQNAKIEQVKESTLVVGVDIGSETHYARAFDYRGKEVSKRVFKFSSDLHGFTCFYEWLVENGKRAEAGRRRLETTSPGSRCTR